MKFEKLAEVKANYDVLLKRLKPAEHAEKIEKLKGKKEAACQKVKQEIDADKQRKIAEIKEQAEAKKNLQLGAYCIIGSRPKPRQLNQESTS